MAQFIVRRVLQAIPTLIGVTMLSFLLLHIVPGDPARVMLGQYYTPARAQAIDISLGLNHPLYIQYLIWLWNLIHLNLGYSYQYSVSVGSLIAGALPHTLLLVAIAITVAHVLSVLLGTVQGYVRNTPFDVGATVVNYFFFAMPPFWLGIVLIMIFAIALGWLPSGGITNSLVAHPSFGDVVRHLVLPDGTLILLSMAVWSRYMRTRMVETLQADFIRTARAKGLTEARVVVGHALRNSVMPLITLLGLSLPALFAGALVIEEIFNYPGMGLLFFNAANERDYPTLLGIIVIVGALTIFGNLLADLLYGMVDPRIQYN